ncbi:DUF721 domain-containing protein [Chelativorans sp. M5D2P16]|uniref:DUF721 domain-containing protein n=1 Tax=Chelativorans sp. M5D2P16 TaxID=3095678 RepID=UPI002ACAA038|nr:DciA family protein [Chelativorans sp. M5D2P16]MDZ5698811.1 DciA family protein [Chelativorans sp. M5D2P16]
MAGKGRGNNPVPVSDLASDLLDPVLRRRAGLSIDLVQCWAEIVGERLAERTRPEKIAWPRRMHEDDPFEPATLVIACSGPAALHVQHETSEIIARANAFLGFGAIGRVRIVQKQVNTAQAHKRPRPRPLSETERRKLARITDPIEDEGLRASLERLGSNVLAARKKPLADS